MSIRPYLSVCLSVVGVYRFRVRFVFDWSLPVCSGLVA
jgi:hypothetical protein